MTWQHFALRVVVMAAVVTAFAFTIGLGSIAQTFAIGVAASLASHAVLIGARRISGDENASKTILALCVVGAAGATVFAVLDGRAPSEPLRSHTVDELMARPAEYLDQPMTLHGYLIPGSRHPTGFALEERGARVRVYYQGPIPDTLHDRAEVVATGRLIREPAAADYLFAAEDVSAKRPSAQ